MRVLSLRAKLYPRRILSPYLLQIRDLRLYYLQQLTGCDGEVPCGPVRGYFGSLDIVLGIVNRNGFPADLPMPKTSATVGLRLIAPETPPDTVPTLANFPITSRKKSLGRPIFFLLELDIMLNADLIPGQEYAFREKRIVGSPLHRVKLLKHVRGRKWRAKWIKPNPNLIDYLSTEQVIVPWKDQAAFLKEERDRDPCGGTTRNLVLVPHRQFPRLLTASLTASVMKFVSTTGTSQVPEISLKD